VCGVELSYFKISKEKIKDSINYGLVGFCKNDIEMTRDHTHPKCAGGKNDLSNLVPMCQKCNGKWKSQFDRMLKEDVIDLTEEYYG
jgi:5-methylcytosine-specific restriction endonuclease McrA